MLLYVVCTAGEFVWNEVVVVQLPAPYISMCDFSHRNKKYILKLNSDIGMGVYVR